MNFTEGTTEKKRQTGEKGRGMHSFWAGHLKGGSHKKKILSQNDRGGGTKQAASHLLLKIGLKITATGRIDRARSFEKKKQTGRDFGASS